MLIFLYGEDAFRSRQKFLGIKQKYLNSDKSGSGLSIFDCEEGASSAGKDRVKDIINVISTPNLLAPKRLLIIKNFIAAASPDEQKKILEFLKKRGSDLVEDKDVVAVFWEGNAPKKNSALFKFLDKNAQSQKFEKLTGARLEQWVLKSLKEIDPSAEISKRALEKLVVFCGEDNFLMFSELQKLAGYADKKMISEADVELLVKADLNSNIFRMVEVLGAGDKKEALGLLHTHLEKGDDPFYLLSMFFFQFRNMLKVADLYDRNIRGEYDISRLTKLHPFVVKKSLAQTARFPFEKIKDIYRKLSELDVAVKTGKIEIKLALDKFVAEL